jgi:hypothetical protein
MRHVNQCIGVRFTLSGRRWATTAARLAGDGGHEGNEAQRVVTGRVCSTQNLPSAMANSMSCDKA